MWTPEEAGRRSTLEAFIPYPFGAIKMRERVTDGSETRAKIARELFVRQSGARIQSPQVSPQVVLEQEKQQIRRHHEIPPRNNFSNHLIRCLVGHGFSRDNCESK
jgi:hypothetical protein